MDPKEILADAGREWNPKSEDFMYFSALGFECLDILDDAIRSSQDRPATGDKFGLLLARLLLRMAEMVTFPRKRFGVPHRNPSKESSVIIDTLRDFREWASHPQKARFPSYIDYLKATLPVSEFAFNQLNLLSWDYWLEDISSDIESVGQLGSIVGATGHFCSMLAIFDLWKSFVHLLDDRTVLVVKNNNEIDGVIFGPILNDIADRWKDPCSIHRQMVVVQRMMRKERECALLKLGHTIATRTESPTAPKPPSPNDQGEFFSAEHYRFKYGLNPGTLNKARRSGRLYGEKRGKRWFYPESEVRLLWGDVFSKS